MRFIVTARRCDHVQKIPDEFFSRFTFNRSLLAYHPPTSRNGVFFHVRKPLISCSKDLGPSNGRVWTYIAEVGSLKRDASFEGFNDPLLDKNQQIPNFIPPGFRIQWLATPLPWSSWLKSWLSLRKSHRKLGSGGCGAICFQLAKPPNLEFPTFYHHLFDTVIPTPKIDPCGSYWNL